MLVAQKEPKGAQCFARPMEEASGASYRTATRVQRAALPCAKATEAESAVLLMVVAFAPRACTGALFTVLPMGVGNAVPWKAAANLHVVGRISVSAMEVESAAKSKAVVKAHRAARIFARHMEAASAASGGRRVRARVRS